MVLEQASLLSDAIEVRFAALTHDLGKGVTPEDILPRHIGHEFKGIQLVEELCKRLKVPNKPKELALLVCEFHTQCHTAFDLKPSTILKLLNKLDCWRKPERFEQFLLSCQADALGRTGYETRPYPQADYLRKAHQVCLTINAGELAKSGFKGAAIREEQNKRRIKLLTDLKATINS